MKFEKYFKTNTFYNMSIRNYTYIIYYIAMNNNIIYFDL